ncbi:MAG TPA: hypothetical protein VMM18_14555 [Gemmatimonadaceae bacterium]|nr:hypothetical protein [Gemmatimonadaceae bacterium]
MTAVETGARPAAKTFTSFVLAAFLAVAAACAPATVGSDPAAAPSPALPSAAAPGAAPSPDPRIGLRAGLTDAGEAVWNMRLLSKTPSPEPFRGNINSDLAFKGPYAIQGNFAGFQIWDISDPRSPVLRKAFHCPASQSDVSVYGNLLFVSGEDLAARIDCGTQGVRDTVSAERLRGIRIFDIRDIDDPRNVGNVQTCRGSHTHTVLAHPGDTENVYVYVSGSSPVRSPNELPGCQRGSPDDPKSAMFRIEVIRVPLANPERAAIVSSPRIFTGLQAPPPHSGSAVDSIAAARAAEAARARGNFVVSVMGQTMVLPPQFTAPLLDSLVRARQGTGTPTAADSAALREALPGMIMRMIGFDEDDDPRQWGPNQCHDITVFPAIGLAGGACEGYGLLLDIRDPANPVRIAAAADSNFAYWHSATFNNDGTKVLFTDEWGGGGSPKCRATDRPEWGANALFTIENRQLRFRGYYKLPAPQTSQENCVAHNGSLIPIPGRDVMVQSWYQGGISVFDWTDASRPVEIAFFDRGPVDSTRAVMAGSWSAYWYNGVIVSSEIARGLDILELTPSAHLSQNEIDAAKTVRLEEFNPQMQVKYAWSPSFSLARAYVDQLERAGGLAPARIESVRQALARAERASVAARRDALTSLAAELDGDARGWEADKVRTLAGAVRDLAGMAR